MKKQITTLAVALSFGIVASAAPQMEKTAAYQGQLSLKEAAVSMSAPVSKLVKKNAKSVAKAPVTLDELEGEYTWSYYDFFNDTFDETPVQLWRSEAYPDSLELTLTKWGRFNIGYNLADGTLTFPTMSFAFFSENYGLDVYLMVCEVEKFIDEDGEESGRYIVSPQASHVMNYVDGSFSLGDVSEESTWETRKTLIIGNPEWLLPNGSYQGFGSRGYNTFTKLYPHEFVEAEWESAGTVQYQDGWLYPFYSADPGMSEAYECEALRNKANGYLIAIKNPYGPETPFANVCKTEGTGVIVFDITDPYLVFVQPLWYATSYGYTETENSQEPDAWEAFYAYNLEGFYRNYYGLTNDEVESELIKAGYDITEADMKTDTIYIYNEVFGLYGNMYAAYGWREADMEGVAVFEDLSGIATVSAEDLNAPKEYFNLQGQRVANPEKGQLVIVRQGTRSYKTIK